MYTLPVRQLCVNVFVAVVGMVPYNTVPCAWYVLRTTAECSQIMILYSTSRNLIQQNHIPIKINIKDCYVGVWRLSLRGSQYLWWGSIDC